MPAGASTWNRTVFPKTGWHPGLPSAQGSVHQRHSFSFVGKTRAMMPLLPLHPSLDPSRGLKACIRPGQPHTMTLNLGCANTVETRLGDIFNSTLPIKRSSFLKWVIFPLIFQQKIFFYS